MIKLSNLNRVFRTHDVETTALNGIDLTVEQGEFVAIMGPSGCGKSTLLSILGLLDAPSNGSYSFDGTEVAGFSEQQMANLRKASIGFVFQSFNLIDELTVFENVALPLQYQNVSKSERNQRVEEILKRVAIDHRASHLPQQLSGGQQQRVAVARALVINPKLILADEPTGNLDSKNSQEVMMMLRELNREGTTVIMVTHSETEGEYADRVIRLLDGKIIVDKASQVNHTASVA
ncbi:phosphonate ABC transporter ATP-binding protein [Pseudoalteromonas luteoviolacea CPMOR-2]|uniref:Phosphonate ABC transporter ATP-binding protein n=1 Tax=Pseudoalteromonas luteoviolacea DSM 6061 TaxID=1365250 RepID=A0A166XH97_9GAMM|nr:ABC transporter ATP-binding protein [Pseudoalteromonas luteoviolacea]KZN40317.1 phosphonate ABC transporter ATP-binding protein [Pseudoalteromonas luteoviolacea DSM 6061]KZN57281.1 phosphonate ABC transporter ATP-binding protein [Pseudoalteromonas luteoviolacea CPMOR-2]MBE0387903.1 putative ABC transport system ATP-binding protein [Pseudoalteromonas luteoviolacea DSM 6061]